MNPLEFDTLVRGERELWWFRGMNNIFFGLLDSLALSAPEPRVLDAGCGTGYTASLMGARSGFKVFPADKSWQGLSYAKKAGVQRLVRADVGSLPYAAGSFDLVMCLDVLVHFSRGEEAHALAEFFRVLVPGGKLIIRVAALDALRSRHSRFIGERQRFTRSRLERLAERQGFHVLRCTYANSLLLPAAFGRFRIWEPLMRRPPRSGTAPIASWLDRLLYLPLAAEAKWIGAGNDLPLGQSLFLLGAKA